jgi:hypothetical protein
MSRSITLPTLCVLVILGGLALRLPHLAGPIDNPHAWRQSDTAYYALAFYENGIDLLHPRVCWSGVHDVVALEFPLHEAIVALFYRAFGVDLFWARLVTLAFFVGTQIYLHRIVALVAHPRLAWLTAAVYGLLPLSIFYSRAVHIDFSAVFFAHAMLYHVLRGFGRERLSEILVGVLFGSIGFAIKAPYLFYLYLPLGLCLVRLRVWVRPARAWLPLLVVPGIAFLLWHWHAGQVNADKPVSDLYPQFVGRAEWYFGSLSQRLSIGNWLILLRRLVFDIANPIGTLLLAWGAWSWLREARGPVVRFACAWGLGSAIYVLLFFNLNWLHSYYQIPLLALVALLIAAFLDRLADYHPVYGRLGVAALLVALGGASLWYSGRAYYRVDWRAIEAGRLIEIHTRPSDLIVSYLYDDNHDYADPRLLYQAQRRGWPIQPKDMVRERIERYAQEGAAYLAIVESEPDDRLTPSWLDALPRQQFALRHGREDLGTLYVYDLSTLSPQPASACLWQMVYPTT